MSGKEMKCHKAPSLKTLCIARMPADHTWCTITGADEMKWMWWVWRNGGMKFMAGKKIIKKIINLCKLHFVHHENHMDWPICELRTLALGSEPLTACAMEMPSIINNNDNKIYNNQCRENLTCTSLISLSFFIERNFKWNLHDTKACVSADHWL